MLLKNGVVASPAEDFATDWWQGTKVTGRPVGITVAPDGPLFVSDDTFNLIWYHG